MAPYASIPHVKARAGHLSRAWGESTEVKDADIGIFLQGVADEIDAAIVGLGVSVPAADSTAAKALAGPNADGALILALDATFPSGEGPAAATALQEAARARYTAFWTALMAGRHPATTAPTAEAGETFPGGASDFWTENPYYGIAGYDSPAEPELANEFIDPPVRKGQVW